MDLNDWCRELERNLLLACGMLKRRVNINRFLRLLNVLERARLQPGQLFLTFMTSSKEPSDKEDTRDDVLCNVCMAALRRDLQDVILEDPGSERARICWKILREDDRAETEEFMSYVLARLNGTSRAG